MLEILLAAVLGYLVGAFPTAYLLGRLRGVDVFAVGSGNMGAMNSARHLGKGLGAAVLAIDVAKGALASLIGLNLPVWFGRVEAGDTAVAALVPALVAGAAAILGHCYSVFVGFRGGKGLAAALGVALPVYPLPALLTLVVIVVLVLLLKSSDSATLVTLALYPIVTYVTLEWQSWPRDVALLVTGGVALNCLIGLPKQLQALAHGRRRAHCQR